MARYFRLLVLLHDALHLIGEDKNIVSCFMIFWKKREDHYPIHALNMGVNHFLDRGIQLFSVMVSISCLLHF